MNNNIEIFERLISVNRCTKVTKGGRRFSFSAIVVIGNKLGIVGYGMGKALEVIDARQKAINKAKKVMYKIPLKENRTIYHSVIGKFCSSKILLKPASSGVGIIASNSVKAILDVLGIKDIIVKSIKSNNPHNLIKAVINGLLKTKNLNKNSTI